MIQKGVYGGSKEPFAQKLATAIRISLPSPFVPRCARGPAWDAEGPGAGDGGEDAPARGGTCSRKQPATPTTPSGSSCRWQTHTRTRTKFCTDAWCGQKKRKEKKSRPYLPLAALFAQGDRIVAIVDYDAAADEWAAESRGATVKSWAPPRTHGEEITQTFAPPPPPGLSCVTHFHRAG